MPGQFIDDAEPQFIDDAEGSYTPNSNASNDLGIGTTRLTPALMEKLKAGLYKRGSALKGATPLGIAGVPGTLYRAATGENTPSWFPEPTVEGFVKGTSNLVLGPARLKAMLGKKIAQTDVARQYAPFLEDKYTKEAEITGQAADAAQRFYQENAKPSLMGEMLGEAAPFIATGGTSAPASLIGRMGLGAVEGATMATVLNPQAGTNTDEEYWRKQKESAQMGAALGSAAPLAIKAVSPVVRLFKGGKPNVNAASLADDIKARVGEGDPADVFQSDLKRAYEADRAEAGKPYEALRARDAQAKSTPNVELYGGQTSYKGNRFSNLLGPNDEVIVAKTPVGKDAGFLWITKEGDGFTVRKIQVEPEAQRKGIATHMMSEAENAFGPRLGATDQTPQGKAFIEAYKTKGKGEVSLDPFKAKLKGLSDELESLGSTTQDDPVLRELVDFSGRIDRSTQKGWGRALDLSKRLNDSITAARGAKDNYRAMVLKKAKDALEESLSSYPEFKEAKTLWKEKMAPWEGKEEGGTFLKRAMESPVPDEQIQAVIKAKPDKAKIFYDRMTEKGRDAVRSAILDDLIAKAEGDPKAMSKAIRTAEKSGSYGVFFQGDDLQRLNGLEKLQRYASRAGTLTAAGGGAATAGIWGPLSAAGGAIVGTRYARKPLSKGFYSVFKTDAMQRLLLDASKLADDSPELGRLLKQLPKIAGATEETSSDKLKKLLGAQ